MDYLHKGLDDQDVIDLKSGLADLAQKIIRPVDFKNIDDDPLRILRGIRLASIYGFSFLFSI